jgi:hypothetical protein
LWNDTWSNGLFNGIEAAVSAILAHRVAVSGHALTRRGLRAAADLPGLPWAGQAR